MTQSGAAVHRPLGRFRWAAQCSARLIFLPSLCLLSLLIPFLHRSPGPLSLKTFHYFGKRAADLPNAYRLSASSPQSTTPHAMFPPWQSLEQNRASTSSSPQSRAPSAATLMRPVDSFVPPAKPQQASIPADTSPSRSMRPTPNSSHPYARPAPYPVPSKPRTSQTAPRTSTSTPSASRKASPPHRASLPHRPQTDQRAGARTASSPSSSHANRSLIDYDSSQDLDPPPRLNTSSKPPGIGPYHFVAQAMPTGARQLGPVLPGPPSSSTQQAHEAGVASMNKAAQLMMAGTGMADKRWGPRLLEAQNGESSNKWTQADEQKPDRR